MEFSRQEYWSGLPFPSPRDLPDRGTELRSSAVQEDSLLSEPPGKPKKVGTISSPNAGMGTPMGLQPHNVDTTERARPSLELVCPQGTAGSWTKAVGI